MKTRLLILILAVLFPGMTMTAQTIISGQVSDQQTGQPLPHVSILAEGSDVRTVTNDDGRFTLKTVQRPQYVQLSHIGYKTRRFRIEEGSTDNLHIRMQGSSVVLSEIVVSVNDPEDILKAAIQRIEKNYPMEPELARCFYRETAQRGSRFISVAEAVTDMYKSDYLKGPGYDRVAILKGRRLMSMRSKDTLGVKIQGGPVLPLMVDVAKNCDYLLNSENLSHYQLHMELPVHINDRAQYVVRMEPVGTLLSPLMKGLVYIDQQTLAITRAELELDMRDWRIAADYMLVSKPMGLRFHPRELSVTVVYDTDEAGVTRMSYLRNVMRFNCDWKRRLFASTYTTVSEMVVTERMQHGRGVKKPLGRSSFGIKERFYDKVEYFEDELFWADYNIIEPSESLEHAVGKLKKQSRMQ